MSYDSQNAKEYERENGPASDPKELEALTAEHLLQEFGDKFDDHGWSERVAAIRAELLRRLAPPPAQPKRPIDGKFGIDGQKIVNLVSGEEIPRDEPLFLLRARDRHALELLQNYIGICAEDCNELHLAGGRQVYEKFATFAMEHPERMKHPGVTRHLKLEPEAPPAQELKAEVRKFRDVWLKANIRRLTSAPPSETEIELAAAFHAHMIRGGATPALPGAEELARAIERCCELMCRYCAGRVSDIPRKAQPMKHHPGTFVHGDENSALGVICSSSNIRGHFAEQLAALSAKKEEK